MSPFRALTMLAGLSLGEASTFLDARLDTVKAWSSGRNSCPQGALDELSELIARQEGAADEAINILDRLSKKHGWPQAVEISVSDDWPCEGARWAVIARIVSALPEGQSFTAE